MPEWGPGTVTRVQAAAHEGKPCQRLTIRFERAGLKTLSTAFAVLVPADERPRSFAAAVALQDANDAATRPPSRLGAALSSPVRVQPPTESDDHGWLNKLEDGEFRTKLERVPESALDPFIPTSERVKNTYRLFQFTKDGGSLVAWATAQTGVADPLGHMSRPELERVFDRFRRNLDNHLIQMMTQMRRSSPADFERALAIAPPAAQQVLRRANLSR